MSGTYFSQAEAISRTLGRNVDIWCNVVFWNGDPTQTVSEHAALDAQAKRIPGCILCAVLAVLVQWGHCPKTLDPNASTPASAYVRAGLCFIILLGIIGHQLVNGLTLGVTTILSMR
jgi:hypothetical protein